MRRDDVRIYLTSERDPRGRVRHRVTISQRVPGKKKPERSSQTFTDEGEAREHYAELLKETRRLRELTVGDLIDMWLEDMGRRVKPETVRVHRRMVSDLCGDLEAYAADIDPAQARELYRRYQDGRKPGTHRQALQMTKALWRWALEEGHVRRHPFRRVVPEGVRDVRHEQLYVDEARKLDAEIVAEVYPQEIGPHTRTRRMGAAAAALALYCGLRNSEIRSLLSRHVDDGGRLVWVEKGKTRHASRAHVVPAFLRPALRSLADEAGGGRVFPRGKSWLEYQVTRLCRAAHVRRVPPHGLRGTHSSLARREGATSEEVASALGHGGTSGVRVAERHYIDPSAAAAADGERVAKVISLPTRSPQDETG